MKKIVPFKKEMLFNTNVSEITSISLEQNLGVKDKNLISGDFIISGEYRMSDSSINTEEFNFELPCDINLDDKYIIDNAQIDIDDFYYEVINSNILKVNIDVSIDKIEQKIEEKPVINEIDIKRTSLEEMEKELSRGDDNMSLEQDIEKEMSVAEEVSTSSLEEERCIEAEDIQPSSIFNSFSDDREMYKTYKICIVREGDMLESIMEKYGVTREILEQYNDLKEINLGDKLIIPDLLDEKNQ